MTAAPAPAETAQAFLAKVTAGWNNLKTYDCTITAHEVKGDTVQDRVYHYSFSKPLDTRAEIVAGDGRGSLGIWRGGDRVRGHRGGLLRAFTLNVPLNSHLATTLRGATFAQTNLGAILQHLRSVASAVHLNEDAEDVRLTVKIDDPATTGGITKEIFYFGKGYLPVKYEQFEGDRLVNRVEYSDMKIDVVFPPRYFEI
ncbi:MAG: hypothetical protein M3Z37_06340 [Candidatus Eremiobacteraeota bacterium]|nr:hypothetical protein [Candidatus Eremiobacteraeota bacterium]